MKSFASSIVLLATVMLAAPAMAASVGNCTSLSQQLEKKTAEFVKVNANGRNPAQPVKASPADFQRGVSKRDTTLHAIANEVWTVRADMASRGCAQADAFTY